MATFQQTGNETTKSTKSTSSASDDGFSGGAPPLQLPRRSGAATQSRPAIHSPWIQRLRSVHHRSRGCLPGPSRDLHHREERSSPTCAIRARDVRGERVQENNLPESRTPDVTVFRVTNIGERNVSLSSSSSGRHVGNFVENTVVSSRTGHSFENTRDSSEPGDRSLESSQPVGSVHSGSFVKLNSADECSTHCLPAEYLFSSPSSSRTPPKVWDACKMEKLEMGKVEDCPVEAQGRMFQDDVLSSFEHMHSCSAGKGLHQEVQGSFPFTGIKNIPWSTELSSFHDTCSASSSALIRNLHCNNIGVSRPLVLENNSDANKMAISGKYAQREKILHVNKYNSQTFSGVKGIHKIGQVCKQMEIVDSNSGLSGGTLNPTKTANLWKSRFKESSLPNKAIQEGGNIDGPLQGSSEDVIVRSITKDKGVHEIHPYSRKEKQPTLSSLLWLQHWRCSNVRVTQRLVKTCPDPNQNCQIDSVIKGSLDSNTSDTCGSLKIVQDPVKNNSVERG